MQKALGWFGGLYRPQQRLNDQVFGHAHAHGVADDFAGAQILVPDQVEPALIGGDIGYIAQPGRDGAWASKRCSRRFSATGRL